MKQLDEIEAIVTDLEKLDAETNGQFRQASDREAYDIVARIERKMRRKIKTLRK